MMALFKPRILGNGNKRGKIDKMFFLLSAIAAFFGKYYPFFENIYRTELES
jgi:hypothetical protein